MNSILEHILPARTLGIRVSCWNGSCIELTAPLEKNLNDKGTAFAGSIDAMLDLAGWSAITLALRDAGTDAVVMIVKSETAYTDAVMADMIATAEIPDREIKRMLRELASSGRIRVDLHCRLFSGGSTCASMNARYAVSVKTGSSAKAAQ